MTNLPAENDLDAIRKRDAESSPTWYTGPASPAAVARRDRRALLAEIERLRAALDSFVRIAHEAATEWDNGNDARVGKILIAMSGRVPGYRADIDAIHALRSAFDVPAKAHVCVFSHTGGPIETHCVLCGAPTRSEDPR